MTRRSKKRGFTGLHPAQLLIWHGVSQSRRHRICTSSVCMYTLGSQFWMLGSCREPFLELFFRSVLGLALAATAACLALPDADMLTATNSRILGHKQHTERRGALSSLFPCCLRVGLYARWQCTIGRCAALTERLYGFTVFLKRKALTEEKIRPFLDPQTPCLLTPSFPKI